MSQVPNVPESESNLIASAFVDINSYYDVATRLRPEMFYTPAHQTVWAAIGEVISA